MSTSFLSALYVIIYVCMNVYMFVYMYVGMYVCTYVCMYVVCFEDLKKPKIKKVTVICKLNIRNK